MVLAAFVAATAGMKGYQKNQEQKAAQKEEAEKVYALQFSSDDVTGIAYEKDGEWLAFTKNDDTWSCETDTAASIDSDKMKNNAVLSWKYDSGQYRRKPGRYRTVRVG